MRKKLDFIFIKISIFNLILVAFIFALLPIIRPIHIIVILIYAVIFACLVTNEKKSYLSYLKTFGFFALMIILFFSVEKSQQTLITLIKSITPLMIAGLDILMQINGKGLFAKKEKEKAEKNQCLAKNLSSE